jgi:hypothetical protein
MDVGSIILLVVVFLTVLLLAAQFRGATKFKSLGEEFSHNFGQGIYGTLAAVAIITAGVLYLVERQWSPRFSVDLKTRAVQLPVNDGNTHAVIQLLIAVRNLGRTEQEVKNIEVWADSLQDVQPLVVNPHGDLPGRTIFHFPRKKTNRIAPGEMDLIAVEIPVLCSESLVRILVKVPKPPYREKLAPNEKRDVYERKTLVSVGEPCESATAITDAPFLSSGLEPTE